MRRLKMRQGEATLSWFFLVNPLVRNSWAPFLSICQTLLSIVWLFISLPCLFTFIQHCWLLIIPMSFSSRFVCTRGFLGFMTLDLDLFSSDLVFRGFLSRHLRLVWGIWWFNGCAWWYFCDCCLFLSNQSIKPRVLPITSVEFLLSLFVEILGVDRWIEEVDGGGEILW